MYCTLLVLVAMIKVFDVLPAQLPLILYAGTVVESVPQLICAGFVYGHCAREGGGYSAIHTVKIAVNSAKGDCKATTVALTSNSQKSRCFVFLTHVQ